MHMKKFMCVSLCHSPQLYTGSKDGKVKSFSCVSGEVRVTLNFVSEQGCSKRSETFLQGVERVTCSFAARQHTIFTKECSIRHMAWKLCSKSGVAKQTPHT